MSVPSSSWGSNSSSGMAARGVVGVTSTSAPAVASASPISALSRVRTATASTMSRLGVRSACSSMAATAGW